ncbi:sigma-70 family RNA polymerase sigma factor [Actinoplanes sp. NPDC004185]
MTGSNAHEAVARAFEAQRERLVAVAYRMLGSRADAEDAVQEAWLRLARQEPAAIDNLPGWLTTVVGRVCIDVLRSRRARPEAPSDQLPELIVAADPGDTPEDTALLTDSVGSALMVVLDTLRPAERLAFVLHHMFAVPFQDIAPIVGRSPDATKMLAHRARRKLQDRPRAADAPRRQRAVVDAFIAASRDGDFDGLLRVLDPDVTWRAYTGRGVVVRRGATEVAARARHGVKAQVSTYPVLVNGEPGFVVSDRTGRPLGVMACTVAGGRIIEMVSVTDPERLASMDLPGSAGAG